MPKRKLNQHMVARIRAKARTFLLWDTHQHGLALQVRPSGHKSWKAIYSHRNRPRWYTLGNAAAISVGDARKLAGRIMFAVAEGKDPQAERQAHRSKGTFEELCERYVNEYAKKEKPQLAAIRCPRAQAPVAALGQTARKRDHPQRR